MGKINKVEQANEHIAEEMVEHLILEKVGALPNHGHSDAIPLKKKLPKKLKKNYNFEFFTIMSIIIVSELWYLWNYFTTK
ncbi:MAG: hypothetical protein DSZ07_03520 [Sulfurovum sp.]|nr:MAG: hypothetical protein DSZ07_03520 [Sulfurovum sp.]